MGADIFDATIPHADHGDPECCGCLMTRAPLEGVVDVVCNECGKLIGQCSVRDVKGYLRELAGEVITDSCPHCGEANHFPGFDQILAYLCHECGEPVS
jgi:predicted RNA-binding Zn-ribbon protein involved in translation (DUF1610 family)